LLQSTRPGRHTFCNRLICSKGLSRVLPPLLKPPRPVPRSQQKGSPGCCRRSYPKPSSHQGLCRGHSRKALAVACRGPSTTGTGSRRPRSGLPWPASSTNGHNLECPASSWALLLPPTAWTRPNTAIRCRAWSFLLPAWSCCCGLAASRLQSRTAYG